MTTPRKNKDKLKAVDVKAVHYYHNVCYEDSQASCRTPTATAVTWRRNANASVSSNSSISNSSACSDSVASSSVASSSVAGGRSIGWIPSSPDKHRPKRQPQPPQQHKVVQPNAQRKNRLAKYTEASTRSARNAIARTSARGAEDPARAAAQDAAYFCYQGLQLGALGGPNLIGNGAAAAPAVTRRRQETFDSETTNGEEDDDCSSQDHASTADATTVIRGNRSGKDRGLSSAMKHMVSKLAKRVLTTVALSGPELEDNPKKTKPNPFSSSHTSRNKEQLPPLPVTPPHIHRQSVPLVGARGGVSNTAPTTTKWNLSPSKDDEEEDEEDQKWLDEISEAGGPTSPIRPTSMATLFEQEDLQAQHCSTSATRIATTTILMAGPALPPEEPAAVGGDKTPPNSNKKEPKGSKLPGVASKQCGVDVHQCHSATCTRCNPETNVQAVKFVSSVITPDKKQSQETAAAAMPTTNTTGMTVLATIQHHHPKPKKIRIQKPIDLDMTPPDVSRDTPTSSLMSCDIMSTDEMSYYSTAGDTGAPSVEVVDLSTDAITSIDSDTTTKNSNRVVDVSIDTALDGSFAYQQHEVRLKEPTGFRNKDYDQQLETAREEDSDEEEQPQEENNLDASEDVHDVTLPDDGSFAADDGSVDPPHGATTVSYTHLTLPTNREV